MNNAVGNEVLLTSDDVRRWHEDLRKLEQSQKETEVRIADLRKKLGAVALISGAKLSFPESASDAITVGSDGQETMGEAAKRLLATFSRPILHHELQTELRKIPRFREILDKNNGGYYYTVIMRLAKRGDIKKVGKKIRLIHKNEAPSEGTPEGAS